MVGKAIRNGHFNRLALSTAKTPVPLADLQTPKYNVLAYNLNTRSCSEASFMCCKICHLPEDSTQKEQGGGAVPNTLRGFGVHSDFTRSTAKAHKYIQANTCLVLIKFISMS